MRLFRVDNVELSRQVENLMFNDSFLRGRVKWERTASSLANEPLHGMSWPFFSVHPELTDESVRNTLQSARGSRRGLLARSLCPPVEQYVWWYRCAVTAIRGEEKSVFLSRSQLSSDLHWSEVTSWSPPHFLPRWSRLSSTSERRDHWDTLRSLRVCNWHIVQWRESSVQRILCPHSKRMSRKTTVDHFDPPDWFILGTLEGSWRYSSHWLKRSEFPVYNVGWDLDLRSERRMISDRVRRSVDVDRPSMRHIVKQPFEFPWTKRKVIVIKERISCLPMTTKQANEGFGNDGNVTVRSKIVIQLSNSHHHLRRLIND